MAAGKHLPLPPRVQRLTVLGCASFPIIHSLSLFLVRRRAQLMKAYMCVICGYLYEEEKGDPTSGIAAGTRWEDVPLSWRCPDCGAGKEDFEMVEI